MTEEQANEWTNK